MPRDAIACYDGRSKVQHVKDVAQGRSNPYILPIADDDAIIFGHEDVYGQLPDTVWVDRVKGGAFRVPLLEQWRPVYTDQPFSSDACRIDAHTYLLAATNDSGQLGFVVVRDTVFTLLPTTAPVPMQSQYGTVFYKGPVVTDRQHHRGYVVGVDSLCHHQFVLAIDYARQPATLTLYHTDSIDNATVAIPVVTPEGDLILAGGSPDNNYKPLSAVWLYHFATPLSSHPSPHTSRWPWLVLCGIGLAALAYIIIYIRRKRKQDADSIPPTDDEELMQRICQLIELDQRYLTARLRQSDIALELGVSVAALSRCIDSQRHCTFAQLIAEYRVRHAQQLLAEQPDMKLSSLIAASGFTSESTFFRTFKAVTGLSPKAMIKREQSDAGISSAERE